MRTISTQPSRQQDEERARLYEEVGATEASRRLGMTLRGLQSWRKNAEKRLRRQIVNPVKVGANYRTGHSYPGRVLHELLNGTALVGSDWHIWPGPASFMHRAFVKFCKDVKPNVVVANGDVMDFSSISRHAPLGWEEQPEVYAEIEAAEERLGEIETAASKAHKYWTLGNHDARYEIYLAQNATKFKKLKGFHLKDNFPLWLPCWSVDFNDDVICKHRFRSGIHAPHNNVVNAGKSIVTGHLHSAKVTPWTDYRGTRFGVDTGCIADPYGDQFQYMEDNPRNWRSAFCLLTFHKGTLLWPELITPYDENSVQFRGQIIQV